MGGKLIEMTGKVFGRLTVRGRAPNTTGDARWYCSCECGRDIIIWGANLRSGNSPSCGCIKSSEKPDRQAKLRGARFGRLLVLDIIPRRRRGNREWLCMCDCGVEKVVKGSHLVDGNTISCGCAANLGPSIKVRPLDARERASVKSHIRRMRKGVTSDWFNPEQIKHLFAKQRGRCANCRCKITFDTMHKDHIIALSRGGSNSIRNIQLLCVPCNRKKHNKDPVDFAREQGRLL